MLNVTFKNVFNNLILNFNFIIIIYYYIIIIIIIQQFKYIFIVKYCRCVGYNYTINYKNINPTHYLRLHHCKNILMNNMKYYIKNHIFNIIN